ncbi:MAG: hypothetical protein WD490_07415 [Opitutales bacterium]
MIIIDSALKERARSGNPVRVGLVGAGFMGKGIAYQIVTSVAGLELAAISNRSLENARQAYTEAGVPEPVAAETAAKLAEAIRSKQGAITEDPFLLCESEDIDVLVEVTGAVEFSAVLVLRAIEYGKDVVLMNAELDGTIGPILKRYADRAGVILTACDGDQPGVEMNLFRYVKALGLTPLLCGNIKGLHDPYRNPATQESFARRWGQQAHMVTSFADGTKISFEQAIVANATGMSVAKRGMLGYNFDGHVDDMTGLYDVPELRRLGGIVDYVVGAKPSPGVFVFATSEHPRQRQYLQYYKLGPGPLYSFYTPYHLCHLEVPLSIARVALFRDTVLAPLGAPQVDVVATAKTDLKAGQVLDGIGHYTCYGQCENASVTHRERLLPMGLASGCRLLRDIPKDQVLSYSDVELPPGRVSDALRKEQDIAFARNFEPGLTGVLSGHSVTPSLHHSPELRGRQ